jgi:protein-disulfide isomerase
MRYVTALALSLMLSMAPVAFAADELPAPEASKAPAAVDNGVSPAPGFTEPNLKPSKISGGRTTSNLIKDAPLHTDFVMGNPKSPLIMIEYASLSCPHCAHFSTTVLPALQKDYIDTGKMRYILRPFPLNESALKGAMLLDCIGEQNQEKYYVFAKVLFDAQSKWAFDANFMSGLETIATVGGLSKEQFQNCVNKTDREIKILKLKKDAEQELKVPHTPYIFIGDEAYEGDRSPVAIEKFIDGKLAEIQPPAKH